MKDWTALRARYMRDGLPVRLGGLAANLARIRSFSDHADHCEVVKSLVEESKWFIEWTTPDAGFDLQAELVELQIRLAQWQLKWASTWAAPARRAAVAEEAGLWSERVLKGSGLSG